MPWSTLLLAAAPAAFPCAALVHEVGALAESDAQEVILWQDGDEAVTEYRVAYDGDAAAFGWIIVVPAGFASLSDGDPARFDALREATAPQVWTTSDAGGDGGGGCGCLGAAKGDAAGGRSNALDTGGGWDILAEGFTGTYSYTAFSAEDAQGLGDALNMLGWPAEGAQASLETYAAEGGVDFVLVEVRPDVAETDGARSLPPVVLRSTADRLFFPSRMALGAQAEEMRTVVWVLGDERARVSGWDMVDLDQVEASGGETAEAAWDGALRDASAAGPAFARTWAGVWQGARVTRFETLTPTAAHTLDADFHADDGEVEQGSTVEVWATAMETGAALLLPPLLGAGVWVRRRAG
jgi:hypothetical protein